jgi:hypothetical protein
LPYQVLIRQGDTVSSFYMVVQGSCSIEIMDGDSNEAVLVNTIGPGSYFGELSMILKEETHATVKAREQSVLLSISPDHFPLFFGGNLHMMAEVRIRLGGANTQLRHFLMHSKGREIFKAHLEREHAEEHLCMYDAIVNHEDEFEKAEIGEEERLENIMKVYEEYIKEGSKGEVNVPSTMKDEIRVIIENKSGTVGCFEHIKIEIFKLMERDNFRRYKQTEDFETFLADIGGLYTGINVSFDKNRHRSMQFSNIVRSPARHGTEPRTLLTTSK